MGKAYSNQRLWHGEVDSATRVVILLQSVLGNLVQLLTEASTNYRGAPIAVRVCRGGCGSTHGGWRASCGAVWRVCYGSLLRACA